jgi:hypothetical protein
MTLEITGETPFQVLGHSFTVSPSSEGYTLNYSADGVSYTAYEESTPANENLIVNGIAWGQYIKLVGNNSKVIINY